MKPTPPQTPQECHLDELGYCFVRKCIEIIESRGLDDQGLYRIGGVNSRVARLLHMCLDRKNFNPTTGKVNMPDFSDPVDWETKTITSALKNYLRNLSEPLMTYSLHPVVIEAAKIEDLETRSDSIKKLIQQLPVRNFTLLKILVKHLKNVASHSQTNLMTVSNLGICFAPTLMRGPEETASSIMEIKYSNVVASTLIEDYDSIFNDPRLNLIHQQQQQQQNNQNQPQYHSNDHLNSHNNNNNSINNNIQQNHQHQVQFTTSTPHPMIQQNHDEQFGLGLPPPPPSNNQRQQQQQRITQQQNQYLHSQQQQHQQSNYPVDSSINCPNKPFKCQNGNSNDLAQFALKSYDHPPPSRPTPTFISTSSIPSLDIRPINDLKTYSYDQALMVPSERQHQNSYNPMGGSMNNSLNYIGFPNNNSQPSSHMNSLNYSSNSLNSGTLGDHPYINQSNYINQQNSYPYYSLNANKLPYRSNKVVTLYACVADTESELSFGPNEVIVDGK